MYVLGNSLLINISATLPRMFPWNIKYDMKMLNAAELKCMDIYMFNNSLLGF